MKTNTDEVKESTSCGAVIWRYEDKKIELLLIKQFAHKDSWGIPKGHIYEGETLEQCAIREVREEAGVDIVLGERLTDVMTAWRHEKKRVVSYLAQQVGDAIPNCNDPDCEVADVRWFGIDELPKIHIYQGPLIAEAINKICLQFVVKAIAPIAETFMNTMNTMSRHLDNPPMPDPSSCTCDIDPSKQCPIHRF